MSPKIAEILRLAGIDVTCAHDVGMLQASDIEQLKYASLQERCMVTRNRADFIKLAFQFFNESRPHFGVLIVPYSHPGDSFSRIATALKKYAMSHKHGLDSYTIDFL